MLIAERICYDQWNVNLKYRGERASALLFCTFRYHRMTSMRNSTAKISEIESLMHFEPFCHSVGTIYPCRTGRNGLGANYCMGCLVLILSLLKFKRDGTQEEHWKVRGI